MSVVRPEFGPTLPALLRPRLAALPRPVRLALLGVAAAAAVVVLALLLRGGGSEQAVVVRAPVAYNFIYRAPLHRAPAPAGMARAAGSGQSFTVTPVRLPAYRGDPSGFLPIYAAHNAQRLARTHPGFQLRQEGRANVNKIQGYELVFQFRRGGRLHYGRRIVLLPDEPSPRQGVALDLEAARTPAIPRADAVGRNGALKTSLRSFRFGTQRP